MSRGTVSNLFETSDRDDDVANAKFVPSIRPVVATIATPASQPAAKLQKTDRAANQSRPRFLARDITAFFTSLITHVVIILLLALIPIINNIAVPIVIQAMAPEQPVDIDVTELAYSDTIPDSIGSNSVGEIDAALSAAPNISDVSEVPLPDFVPSDMPKNNVIASIERAVGATQSPQTVRGSTGYGVSGTEGAIDRITHEIIKSIQERPTLVVWLFDSSISLSKRREEVRARFDRVYKEISAITGSDFPKGKEPLLTAIYSYGEHVRPMLDKPIADPKVIQKVVGNIDIDPSGIEMTFAAINAAAEKYRDLRITKTKVPERNVMIIAVTDERGNDSDQMDHTIELCKNYGMPVYVLGVPAPFGRSYTYIKYANPDPKNNGEGVWGQIDQGPETFMLERPLLGYGQNNFDEVLVDSGFGPYCLSRVCYETGGIFFTIHPNRVYDRDVEVAETETYAAHLQHFFDPAVMERYRPDYLSEDDYDDMLRQHPFRAILVDAAQQDAVGVLRDPKTQFIKHEALNMDEEIAKAMNISESIEPGLQSLCQSLKRAQAQRVTETSPRWLAGYDLANASANAERIRNELYHRKLAELKRDKKFHYAESNVWVLKPSIEYPPELKSEADEVTATLERIIADNAHTPWAYLAQRELRNPLGWSWTETHMTITITRDPGGGNGVTTDSPNRSRSNTMPKF